MARLMDTCMFRANEELPLGCLRCELRWAVRDILERRPYEPHEPLCPKCRTRSAMWDLRQEPFDGETPRQVRGFPRG